jgi:hypothetical protein
MNSFNADHGLVAVSSFTSSLICTHRDLQCWLSPRPFVAYCRYPAFALSSFNASAIMQAPINANIPLRFAVSRSPQRCQQSVLVGIGFVPVTRAVNNTNPWTGLGSACLADAPAGATNVAAAGRKLASNVVSDDIVSIQRAEIKAVYEEACVRGWYVVTVQAPEAAGCYYFVLRLADASRQIMVLRVTDK